LLSLNIIAQPRTPIYSAIATSEHYPLSLHDALPILVAVLHDMTREKEVAEMKNDFVSSVSHELRTPLASIKAYVEMLIDGEAEKDRKSTRLNSSHVKISYAVFCLKKKNKQMTDAETN